jgi:tetratricopeptide (TPR) repeat protein
MKSKNAAATFWFLFCFLACSLTGFAHGNGTGNGPHTVRGMVITIDGTVVPEFNVVVRRLADRPELLTRRHFKNGEFTIDGLTGDKYQLVVSSPSYISSKIEYDFKAKAKPLDHTIVILHTFRNERRLTPGAAYKVSLRSLEEKIPDAARQAYEKGVALHRDGKLEEALTEYGKALRTYPDYVEALSDLATIFLLYNRPESAMTFLRRAQDLDASNPVINLNVAIAMTEQGDFGGAMRLLKKLLHDNPHLGLPHYYIGKIHYVDKKWEEAESSAQKAVDLDPQLLDAWLLIVNASMEQNRYDQAREALTHIRQAINNVKVAAFIDEQLSTLGS